MTGSQVFLGAQFKIPTDVHEGGGEASVASKNQNVDIPYGEMILAEYGLYICTLANNMFFSLKLAVCHRKVKKLEKYFVKAFF